MAKRSIYELTDAELASWLAERGEPAYRLRQILAGVYGQRVASAAQLTALPKALRAALAEAFEIGPLPILERRQGRDSIKLLMRLPDGQMVEAVRMQTRWGATACVSCQVGCAVGCRFCASGVGGLGRNLRADEILRQVLTLEIEAGRVTNVVFMGMGEPLHNYEAVLRAVQRLTAPEGFGLSPRHVTVGTAGVVPLIPRLGREAPKKLELAVSLGAPVDELRRWLMPGVSGWSLAELLAACDEWTALRSGQPVTYAYVLIGGINDHLEFADQLAALVRGRRHHVNLIPLNRVEHVGWEAPSGQRVERFAERLAELGVNVSVRRSRGRDVQGACGQLRRHWAARPRLPLTPASGN
jgi:23S rRNA (adenine2503-C2)-methyltransferase